MRHARYGMHNRATKLTAAGGAPGHLLLLLLFVSVHVNTGVHGAGEAESPGMADYACHNNLCVHAAYAAHVLAKQRW